MSADKMRWLNLVLALILMMGVASAYVANSSSYSVGSMHQGSDGGNMTSTSYTARSTMTYQQPSNRFGVTTSYNGNIGWFNLSQNISVGPNVGPENATISGFVNYTTSHAFNVTAYAEDANGGADITDWNWSISAGTCVNASNTVSGVRRTIILTCTGTVPATAQITLTFRDSGNLTANSSTAQNAYPDHVSSLTAPSISPSLNNANSTLNCTPGVFSDIDGDTENTSNRSWAWFLNGTNLNISTQTLDPGNFSIGDTIICQEFASNWTWPSSNATTNSSSLVINNITTSISAFAIIDPLNSFIFGPGQCSILLTTNGSDTYPVGISRNITCNLYTTNGTLGAPWILSQTKAFTGTTLNQSMNFSGLVSGHIKFNCSVSINTSIGYSQNVSGQVFGSAYCPGGPSYVSQNSNSSSLYIIFIIIAICIGAFILVNKNLSERKSFKYNGDI